MERKKYLILLAGAATAAGLTACGGGSGGGGGSDDGGGDGSDTAALEVTGDVTDLGGRGDWGSLVMSGYGKTNAGNDDDQLQTEAVPDGVTRWFGGTDNADSSGTIEYVVLAETGEAFRPDEEVQGATLEGVGSGTTISHVQVTNSDDDGIEWFGGAADADHVVIQGVSDDSLDMDLGYQGVVQNALVIQGTNFGDRGMETDNNGDDFAATPKSSPVMANVTILGNDGNEGVTMGSMRREGFGGQLYRAVYSDTTAVNGWAGGGSGQFGLGCIDVDDELDGTLEYSDVIFNCTAGQLVDDDDSYQDDFQDSGRYNVTEEAVSFDATTLAVNANASTDGSYDTVQDADGNDFDTGDYFGAVDPNGDTWWDGWTLKDPDIEGNLPGGGNGLNGGAEFHPLKAEIEDGTITPASSAECADKGKGLAEAGTTDVFGKEFPVCVIRDGDLDGNYKLTNDHVYLLDGTVQVGNGDVEEAHDKSTVREDVLTVEKGTQIMGVSDTDPSLVITRGSKIQAKGTAEQPIIFGAVDAE